ncbi:MAG: aminotransferase class I/II-fold pyridoxal phosphate-dependent enzyme [Deltaproteobacteria bacterium]|nr:aminotransferase class I/II-fold pyridoxal phosphate-dependent enzyme [Deltaproteobacteria bacterium]
MIAERLKRIRPSGVRRIFDMASRIKDPIDLSLGEPDFDIPEGIKREGIRWIEGGFNKYTLTQGIPELRQKVEEHLKGKEVNCEKVMITAGVTGGLLLCCLSLIDPGDEVLIPDPYFVMFEYQVLLMGGIPRYIDTYPNFRLREGKIREVISPRTKLIIINSPANPTGTVYSREELEVVADIARERDLMVISDDIYESFVYDAPAAPCMGQVYERTITLGGFSKTWGMTGWRLGYAAGPEEVIQQMITLQQYSFTCPPSFAQKAALVALDYDMGEYINRYKEKRDFVYEGLKERYRVEKPRGAFFIFPEAHDGDGEKLVEKAISKGVFIIPGDVFSQRKSHFRISFAAPIDVLERGVKVLREL